MVTNSLNAARQNMIEQQIRPWNVLDVHILDLLRQIPRENFVQDHHKSLAFMDMSLPILNQQTMLEPKQEARLLQELQLKGNEHVALIGAGSGYLSALIAHQSKHVEAYEKDQEISALAIKNLINNRINNVTVHHENGLLALSEKKEYFDAIILCGALPSVPHFLVEALKKNIGRLVLVIGTPPSMTAVRVDSQGEETVLFDTLLPYLEYPNSLFSKEFTL
jgi:protein-L-isoaspartate(D-aspartate) O-methyltransferase